MQTLFAAIFNVDNDIHFMQFALESAKRGEGRVEPNPMVGCVLVQNGRIVGKGFHKRYGGPHAEVEAIRNAGEAAQGATAYVTLEPCSHHGKTPPCTEAILAAGIRRVIVAMKDPNPQVDGRGLKFLRNAGLEVRENVLEEKARYLLAPYLTLLEKRRPWIVAKWAMTLDGRTASRTGSSRWISGEESRLIVHRIRARMDGILVGAGTVRADDPSLTVRLPEGESFPRVPLRIVLDSRADISMESRLMRTADKTPTLIVIGSGVEPEKIKMLQETGCEVLRVESETGDKEIRYRKQIETLLEHLGKRKTTNLLVEGGSRIFGLLFDARLIDEVHVFIAPKMIGGAEAAPVIGGKGLPDMGFPCLLESPRVSIVDQDIYVSDRTRYPG